MTFDFAFGIGIGLIVPMLMTDHYFSGKIKSRIEEAKKTYCRENAKFMVNEMKTLIEKHRYQSEPPYAEMEEMYYRSYEKQFKTLKLLIDAEEPSRWLKDALRSFFISVVLFLITGILPYAGFLEYSLPCLVVGGIMVIIASYCVLRLFRYDFTIA